MTDLEQRLRGLGSTLDPGAPTPVADLRVRARRRRSRRRFGAVGAVLAVLVLVAAAVRAGGEDVGEEVVAGPSTSAPPATTPGQRSIGDIAGVSMEVTPTDDLVDGQEVTVRIDGLENLPGAQLVMCRGYVDSSSVFQLCDLGAIGQGARPTLTTTQEVRVSRFLTLPGGTTVDCANEPLDCVLGVGASSSSGTRGLAVPLRFRAAAPLADPEVLAHPVEGLAEGTQVSVEVRGLRSSRTYAIVQCTADGRVCSGEQPGSEALTVESDGDGTVRGVLRASTALYGYWGRADCTTEPCVVGISAPEYQGRGASERGLIAAPISFTPGTRGALPALRVQPSGPYDDGQEVTVTGSGFPPGFDVARQLGICPAHLDTAKEERCGRPLAFGSAVVAADGTFRTSMVLRAGTSVGRCQELPSGCVLAWVLNHGPMAASTPVRFR